MRPASPPGAGGIADRAAAFAPAARSQAAVDRRGLRHVLVRALAELLDRLRAEGRDVVGLAAGDQALVDVDLLVDPGAAGVADVGLQRGNEVIVRPLTMPASTSTHGAWQIAAIGLRGFAKSAREAHRVLVRAQEVAVRDAARDQQAVVVVGADARRASCRR